MKMPNTTSSSPIIQFRNCRLLRNHKIIRDDLWVRDGKILNPEELFFEEQKHADVQIDCHDAIICAGFIETQINGAFGVDFSKPGENLEEGVKKVSHQLLSHGVTSYCPTLVTSPPEVYRKALPKIRRRAGSKQGAGILGVHLEGPFINKEKKGAHDPNYITNFDDGFQDVVAMYGDLCDVSIVTLAPEHARSNEVISELVKRRITVSVGHSMANLHQGEQAVAAGANYITHLFNAMLPFHHRDPHLVGLLTSDSLPEGSTVYYGMIADGIHTHPAALRIAHRAHPEGLVLVTDAVPAMGLSTGRHNLGHQVIEITGNRAVIAGTNTLCGSIATMQQCVQYFLQATGCSLVEALEAASLHPAQVLGITKKKGTLDYYTDADFILLDDKLNVLVTYIAGEMVWQHEKFSPTATK